ncbi:MAG: hypothetical protein SOZ40_05155 [Ezakiella sp.]|nr:hypothetical protein [Ezakiella sp.]
MDTMTKMQLTRVLYTIFVVVLPELIQIFLLWKILGLIKEDK